LSSSGNFPNSGRDALQSGHERLDPVGDGFQLVTDRTDTGEGESILGIHPLRYRLQRWVPSQDVDTAYSDDAALQTGAELLEVSQVVVKTAVDDLPPVEWTLVSEHGAVSFRLAGKGPARVHLAAAV